MSTVSPASGGDSYGANIRNTPECSVRSGAGFKITSHLVKRTYLAPNIDSCEKFCTEEVKEFKCLAFSFRCDIQFFFSFFFSSRWHIKSNKLNYYLLYHRYNVDTTNPTDNCLLSEISYDELNFYTDLEPDRDYDIYAMIGDSKICGSRKMESSHPPDGTYYYYYYSLQLIVNLKLMNLMFFFFAIFKSASGELGVALECPKTLSRNRLFSMELAIARLNVSKRRTLPAEALYSGKCVFFFYNTKEFKGKVNSKNSLALIYYRYAPDRNEANCMLSDWPTQEIDPSSFVDIDDAEMYERGSYGRGCEPYPYPLLIPTKQISNGDSRNQGDRGENCFFFFLIAV